MKFLFDKLTGEKKLRDEIEPERDEVENYHSRVQFTIVHQCAAGLVDQENQRPVRKPTEFWASDFCLIEQLSKMKCSCKVPHSSLEGTYRGVAKTYAARVWPWRLAAAVANG